MAKNSSYCGMPPHNDGGGKHDGNHGKPAYMAHIPDHMLSAHTPHAASMDSMSHGNLMSKMGGE